MRAAPIEFQPEDAREKPSGSHLVANRNDRVVQNNRHSLLLRSSSSSVPSMAPSMRLLRMSAITMRPLSSMELIRNAHLNLDVTLAIIHKVSRLLDCPARMMPTID